MKFDIKKYTAEYTTSFSSDGSLENKELQEEYTKVK